MIHHLGISFHEDLVILPQLNMLVAYSVRYDWVVRDIYSKENFTRIMFEGGSYRSVASYPYGIIYKESMIGG